MQDNLKRLFKRNSLFYFFSAALIAQRFFHFKNIIEEPAAWRQFDTEFYAYSFFKNGIDLFKPSVCWLGTHKTLILEFPIISAIISLFYKLFGHSVFYARFTILLFFILSALYLFLIVKKLYYERLAKFTLIVYLLLPMGVYYSRTINIDFPVLFFSLGALYYYILGYEKSSFPFLILATAFSLLGFLTKSPSMFIIYVPLLYFIIQKGKLKLLLKSLPILTIPVIAFVFWQIYSVNINSAAPD
jgi:4-amino-4-deoxy-L-arabinose transferase-like glycosyltransferase